MEAEEELPGREIALEAAIGSDVRRGVERVRLSVYFVRACGGPRSRVNVRRGSYADAVGLVNSSGRQTSQGSVCVSSFLHATVSTTSATTSSPSASS